MATLLYDEKNWPAAQKQFTSIMDKFPGTEQAKRAQQYIATIEAQEKTDSTVVGVILPLSGKYAQMGYKTLAEYNGSWPFNKSNSSPLKLAIIDSEGILTSLAEE